MLIPLLQVRLANVVPAGRKDCPSAMSWSSFLPLQLGAPSGSSVSLTGAVLSGISASPIGAVLSGSSASLTGCCIINL